MRERALRGVGRSAFVWGKLVDRVRVRALRGVRRFRVGTLLDRRFLGVQSVRDWILPRSNRLAVELSRWLGTLRALH